MKYITEKEEARLRRALDISAYDDEEAMAILQNIITEKNAEIVQLTARSEYLYRENAFAVWIEEDASLTIEVTSE